MGRARPASGPSPNCGAHGPNVSEIADCRECLLLRIDPILNQHAGHEGWGGNDGSVRDVLLAHGLWPTDFMESLLSWGYTIIPEKAGVLVNAELLAAALTSVEWHKWRSEQVDDIHTRNLSRSILAALKEGTP